MARNVQIIDLQVQYGSIDGLEQRLGEVNQQLKQTQIGSQAFNELTQEAQQLTAALGDVQKQVEGITLDKKIQATDGILKGFSGTIQGVVGGLGLLGIESEVFGQFEQKAASAIAFGMGLKDVAEGYKQIQQSAVFAEIATKAFGTTTRAALVSTGIGAFVVALGLVVTYWEEIKDAVSGATAETKLYAEAQEAVNGELNTFNQNIIQFNSTVKLAKEGVISKDEALKVYNESLGDTLGNASTLEEAERLVAKNAPLYIQATIAKAEAQILLARAAESAARVSSGEAMELSWWQTAISSFGLFGNAALGTYFKVQNFNEGVRQSNKDLQTYTDKLEEVTKLTGEFETAKPKTEVDKLNDSLKTTVKELRDIEKSFVNLGTIDYSAQIAASNLIARTIIANNKAMADSFNLVSQEEQDANDRSLQTLNDVLEARKVAYEGFAQAAADALGELSVLFNEGSKASKAAALGELAINTGIGFSNGYRIAQQTALAAGPGAAFALPLFYAQQVAVLLSVVNKARGILKAGGSTPAPGAPSVGSVSPNISTQTGASTIPQIPFAPPAIKAYVLSGDVRNAQEADAKLSKRRTLE